MPLIDRDFRSALRGVRPAPYSYQLASLLQSPQIVVVVTLGEQGPGELDVVHRDTSSELSSGAEGGCTTSVDNFSTGVPGRPGWRWHRFGTPPQLAGLCLTCR
jgi:hypothetical protein